MVVAEQGDLHRTILVGLDFSLMISNALFFGRVGAEGDFCGAILMGLNFSLIESEFFVIRLDLASISRGLSIFDREGLLVSVEFLGYVLHVRLNNYNFIKKR